MRVRPLRKKISWAWIHKLCVHNSKLSSSKKRGIQREPYKQNSHYPHIQKVEWHQVIKGSLFKWWNLSYERYHKCQILLTFSEWIKWPFGKFWKIYKKNKTIKSCQQYVHQDVYYKLWLECWIISINRLLKKGKNRLEYLDNSYWQMDKTLSNFFGHYCSCSPEKFKWSDIKHRTTSIK